MNKLFFIIIIISLILFVPVIPQDKKLSSGVVVIEHQCIFDWGYDAYKNIESQQLIDNKTK